MPLGRAAETFIRCALRVPRSRSAFQEVNSTHSVRLTQAYVLGERLFGSSTLVRTQVRPGRQDRCWDPGADRTGSKGRSKTRERVGGRGPLVRRQDGPALGLESSVWLGTEDWSRKLCSMRTVAMAGKVGRELGSRWRSAHVSVYCAQRTKESILIFKRLEVTNKIERGQMCGHAMLHLPSSSLDEQPVTSRHQYHQFSIHVRSARPRCMSLPRLVSLPFPGAAMVSQQNSLQRGPFQRRRSSFLPELLQVFPVA